jgi:signal transduction histidine kinase
MVDSEKITIGDEAHIFADVLHDIETGIIILDTKEKEIFFRNKHALKILEPVKNAQDYDGLSGLLRHEFEELDKRGLTKISKTVIRNDHKVLGYTVYRLAKDQRYVSIFIQDITDQNRLNAIDEAGEMMNNIGYLFSGIRHEIGNPINSIKMTLTVLQNNLKRYSPEEVEVYLKRIGGEVSKMEALLKSFRNFNMFEKPKTDVVDLFSFFEDLIQLLGTDLKKKNIKTVLELAPEARWANVDARALQHVSMNIFANAMDAMKGFEKGKLSIVSEVKKNVVLLTISDNGCGMSKDLLRDAQKPFFTTKKHGTGLGLVISKKMLAQMNCNLEIDSEQGKGTTVTITMPNACIGDQTVDVQPAGF